MLKVKAGITEEVQSIWLRKGKNSDYSYAGGSNRMDGEMMKRFSLCWPGQCDGKKEWGWDEVKGGTTLEKRRGSKRLARSREGQRVYRGGLCRDKIIQ